jgi:hypothetical protein
LTAEGGYRPGLSGLGSEALPLFVWLYLLARFIALS